MATKKVPPPTLTERTCPYCGKIFKNRVAVAAHKRSVHQPGDAPIANNLYPESGITPADPPAPEMPDTQAATEEDSSSEEAAPLSDELSVEAPDQPYVREEAASGPSPPVEAVLGQDETIAIVGIIFDRVASLRGEFWKLTSEEKDAIKGPLTRVLNKHIGKVGKYSDELMLALALGGVVLGKVAQDRAMNATPIVRVGDTPQPQAPAPEAPKPAPVPARGLPSNRELMNEYPGLKGGRA